MDLPPVRRCPFCDCAPVLIELDEQVWVVTCSGCNAIGPHPVKTRQDRASAVELWNRGASGWRH